VSGTWPDAFLLFWIVLKATLLSTGGNGNLPMLHQDLVATRGWLTDQQVAEAVGIGQVAPGPNGLWVVSIGYFLDGVRGALLSALAVALPPFLVLIILRLYRRAEKHPAIDGFVRGLGVAVIGISVVILLRLMAGAGGVTLSSILFAIGGGALMATRRVPVPVILLIAAVAGSLLK
jgi:chromate transporter